MQETEETSVLPLGWDGRLEEEVVTHSSILAQKTPWTGEPGGLMASQGVRQDGVKQELGLIKGPTITEPSSSNGKIHCMKGLIKSRYFKASGTLY